MIGNVTELEASAMRLCADRNGACTCARTWGYPRDGVRECRELMEKVKGG